MREGDHHGPSNWMLDALSWPLPALWSSGKCLKEFGNLSIDWLGGEIGKIHPAVLVAVENDNCQLIR